MSFLKSNLLLILLTSWLAVGCGDLFQKEVVSRPLESSRLRANCEMNVDEFALILEEPIDEAIDCLGQNLKIFIKVVESKKKGYLPREALENFIKKNRKDIKPEVLRALKAVFDINFLIYGEDPDYISEANVDALVTFAKLFNEKAALNFKPIFLDESSIDYENYRVQRDQRIKPAALMVSNALRQIFKPHRNGKIHKLDIIHILDSFTTVNNAPAMSKIKRMLFAKKILLGGDKNFITHIELARLIENFSSYLLLALDGVKYPKIRLNQESMIHFVNADVELLQNLIFSQSLGNRDNEIFFTLREAIDAILTLAPSTDLMKYYDLIKEGKVILMEGHAESVTGQDLKRLFAHGLHVLRTGTLFHRFWHTERVLLDALPGRPIPVNYDFRTLHDLFKHERARVEDFSRIVKNYRFQKGENLAAYYTDDYRRNINAVYEISLFEYGIELIMKKYGCPNNNLEGKIKCEDIRSLKNVYFTLDHVEWLIRKFRKTLIDLDLIFPGRELKTAENITLLGSLFQYQSDDNKVFDINEATEFAISLFSSIGIAEDMNKHFQKLAKDNKCEQDRFGRFEPNCFKANFFESVCLNYPDHFPKLFSSLWATVYERNKLVCRIPKNAPNLAFLETSIKAARTCNHYNTRPTEEIFYSKGDMMSIFLAMMHIETTILRWDTRNLNNIMDPAEVMDAYPIYSPALDGFLEDKPPIIKSLKKQIFQFMVKYEQVPNDKDFGSIWKFVRFLVSFNKQASANRKTIASILVTIGDQGAPSKFDCDLLEDPTSIPPDYDPDREGIEAVRHSVPLLLTADDLSLVRSIEKESDSWIKTFLTINFPNLIKFIF
jgi:hypothetical protein